MTEPETNFEARRRRAIWRATHRGTKEMDWLLGGFATAALARDDAPNLDAFETFLACPDPDLYNAIMSGSCLGEPAHDAIVASIRRFHGLT